MPDLQTQQQSPATPSSLTPGSPDASATTAPTTNQSPAATPAIRVSTNETSRCRRWMLFLTIRLNKLVMILLYPFMVIFTLISLLMILVFCIFPTLLCMSCGICVYYCLMEDPIPLPVLLRYLLSPEVDDGFPHNSNPYAQNRGAAQAQLIIRKVISVEYHEDADGGEIENNYPRRHPGPIEMKTEKIRLHFSELIVYENKQDEDGKDGTATKETDHIRMSQLQTSDLIAPRPDTPPSRNFATSSLPVSAMSQQDNDDGDEPSILEVEMTERRVSRNDNLMQRSDSRMDEEPPSAGEEEESVTALVPPAANDVNTDSGIHKDDSKEEGTEAEEAEHSKPGSRGEVASMPSLEEENGNVEGEGVHPTDQDYFGIDVHRDRGTSCDICLLGYEVDEEVAWSPNLACVHSYHKDCILDWLIRKPSCPNCRNDYLKGNNDENV